jgi:hypothetical protein
MAFKSKYTGPQVEGLLDQMVSGCITVETDPIFSASPASNITDDNIQTWNSKQDTITDLQVIRDGAAKGATALQSIPDNYVTDGALTTALGNKVDKVEGKQLSTEDFTTILKQKLEGLSNYDDAAINQALQGLQTQVNTLVSGNASTAIESFNEIVAFLDGITDSQGLDSIIASIEQQIAGKMDNITLAVVATSGSYNDLKDKPTIPEGATVDSVLSTTSTNAVQNKVVTAELNKKGTYSKPSAGIPKSDLASAVQTSLGKADTALQSYTEQYKGTVTSIKIDNVNKTQSNGIVDLGYIHKQLSTSTSSSMTLSPNIYYRNTSTSLSTLTITLGSVSNSNIINEYFVEFTTRSAGTTVSLPSTIKWANGEAPTFEASTTYQISIVNNLGTIQKFK